MRSINNQNKKPNSFFITFSNKMTIDLAKVKAHAQQVIKEKTRQESKELTVAICLHYQNLSIHAKN